VGKTAPPSSALSIFVGSQGWITKVSTLGPVGSGDTSLPFGADAAACIGVANLFRATFQMQLEDGRCDEMWQMSLIDLDPTSQMPSNPPLTNVDFSDTHLVGLGAIGNGCVWTLSRLRGLHGTLHLIDDQTIDLTNLQRYVLATDGDITRPKVELAKERLSDTVCVCCLINPNGAKYLTQRADWRLPRVGVAVDTAADRQAIQAALPLWIVNAWTQMVTWEYRATLS
jgi:hypothetical protein